MSLLTKIKMLFKLQKPAGQLINDVKKMERNWKEVSFWVSLVGSLAGFAGALSGVIPPATAMLITTGLGTVYNLLKGFQKAETEGVRPPLQSREFWIGAMTILSNGLIEAKTAGVDGEWVAITSAVIAGAMAAAQNLGAKQPKPEEPK